MYSILAKEDYLLLRNSGDPFFGVKYAIEEGNYQVIYVTQDKLLKKGSKSLFFKEFVGGISHQKNLSELLTNGISIFDFLISLDRKKRIIQLNNNSSPVQHLESFNDFEKYFPNRQFTLLDSPFVDKSDVARLTKIIEEERTLVENYNIDNQKGLDYINERREFLDQQKKGVISIDMFNYKEGGQYEYSYSTIN